LFDYYLRLDALSDEDSGTGAEPRFVIGSSSQNDYCIQILKYIHIAVTPEGRTPAANISKYLNPFRHQF